MGFLEAYSARMKAAEESIEKLCKELNSLGYESDPLKVIKTSAFVIINSRKITFGFSEVPYRWYVGSPHSGKTWGLIGEPPHYDCPITVNYLIDYANGNDI